MEQITGKVFHKETFEKISKEKRDHVFTIAVSEFAENGYAATSINHVAKKAGISIGSMYSYFESKENLFLAIVQKGYELLEGALHTLDCKKNIGETIDDLLRMAVHYAKKHPDMNKLYLSMMTEELSHFSEHLSKKFESITIDFYRKMLEKAAERGEIRKDIDIDMAAFAIDNLIVMLQLSFSTTYHGYRLRQYLGAEAGNDENIIAKLRELIIRSLK